MIMGNMILIKDRHVFVKINEAAEFVPRKYDTYKGSTQFELRMNSNFGDAGEI